MKILAIAMDNVPYANSRSHELLSCEEIASLGHEVTVAVERQPAYETAPPKDMQIRVMPVNNPALAPQIARQLGGEFDAAIATSAGGALILAEWRKRHPNAPAVKERRIVAQVLDLPLNRLALQPDVFPDGKNPWSAQWQAYLTGLMACDKIVVNASQTAEDIHAAASLFGIDEKTLPPIETVLYGIDTKTADAAPPLGIVEEIRKSYPAEEVPDAWAIGVSRLVAYKGFDFAIEAMHLLRDEERPGFFIVGAAQAGEPNEGNRLLHLARLAEVDCVQLGGVPDLEKFGAIKESNIGLCLSYTRHIPNQSPVEFVYVGVPAIVSDYPINRERLEGLQCVTFVNPFDTRQVAASIRSVLKEPPSAAAFEADRAVIRERLSNEAHARGLLKVLGPVSTTAD